MDRNAPREPAGLRPGVWGEFVALPETASAVRAVRRVARELTRPGGRATPNPLVLHGPSGTGKTLLVTTLARTLSDHPAAVTVRVVPARELPIAVVDPDADDDLADLDGCDLLAVEDVQHLPARSADGFCRLLDRRISRRRPTLLTATAGPAGLAHLPRRLTSRLGAGLVVQLESLTPAGRRILLERLTGKRNVALTADALDWLAAQATGGGVRPLVGQVERLRTLSRGNPEALDLAAVQRLLADGGPAGPAVVERIIARVAAAFDITPKALVGPNRQRSVLVPRQVAMYLAREVAKLSFPQIGAAFGGRDHTTVLHAVRKVAEATGGDERLRATVTTLTRELE